ncbi:LacI family transcriptional regulator [Verrucomicrobia bacterium LW23]|nr:LacI family transcriptional regulator [Verrucomicrobia bacterium LW23]
MHQVHMTIRQLARLAGVSHATVSRALRDSPRISPEVRERIKKLALETGYQPHPLVSRLMAQLPHIKEISRTTLAVVTATWPDWRTRAFPMEVFTGVELRAKELGYRVEEFALAEYGSCRRLSDVLYARGIEGVIIMPLRRSRGHLSLMWDRFSSVTIGRTLIQPPLHRVTFAHNQNIVLALRKLRRLGYRRIGLALDDSLAGRVENAYVAEYLAYQRTIAESDRIAIFQAQDLPVREVADWLRAQRADAILCNYAPRLAELEAHGFRIPDELGYATLDCFPAPPGIGGIDQQPRAVGSAAVDVLTSHLNRNERGVPRVPKLMMIPGGWSQGTTLRRQADASTVSTAIL